MLIVETLGAVLVAGWLIDRATATPRARAVRVSRRLDEARQLVRRDERY